MKVFFLSVLYTIAASVAGAQNQATTAIEVNPFVRFDSYPEFSYVLNGRPSIDYVTMKGTSFGLNLAYQIPLSKSIVLKPGIGFYKYSFTKISKINTLFGKANSRDIAFLSPLYIPFYTDYYRYTTISLNINSEKVVDIAKDFQFVGGLNLNNYITVSQYYHLTNNPEGSQDFKKSDFRYFGSSVYLNADLLKRFGRIRLGPSIILPVFDSWKTDETFPTETNGGSRNKWLKGIGFGISLNYSLNKK